MIRRKFVIATLVFLVGITVTVARLSAAEFKSDKECVIGGAVADGKNQIGKVVAVSKSICEVVLDDSGKKTSYLFWMLHPAGGNAETEDRLVNGMYSCYNSSGGRLSYTFMDIQITGPEEYESSGHAGRYHVEVSRKIVFESGPLAKSNAKLLAGPRIGLNTNGGTFYSTSCGLAK